MLERRVLANWTQAGVSQSGVVEVVERWSRMERTRITMKRLAQERVRMASLQEAGKMACLQCFRHGRLCCWCWVLDWMSSMCSMWEVLAASGSSWYMVGAGLLDNVVV